MKKGSGRNLVGRRFGKLVVVQHVEPRAFPSGQKAQQVRVWCTGCGALFVTLKSHVVQRLLNACRRCSAVAGADKVSVLLEDGRTIAQVARESGVKLDTVYHRYIRGWPLERLGEPARKRTGRERA